MKKEVKRFHVLEVTDKDIAIGFWYTDGTEEIIVMTLEAAQDLINGMSI